MPEIKQSLLIAAPVGRVWELLANTVYLPKLYPDMITVVADPPGHAFEGQRLLIMAKAGRRIVKVLIRVSEVVPKKRIFFSSVDGGLFSQYDQSIALEATGQSTKLVANFKFKPSKEYIAGRLNLVVLENFVGDNIQAYLRNLKEISELKPLGEAK